MTYTDFRERLKKLNLSNVEFAKITNLSVKTIANWSQDIHNIPKWVEPFLNYYEEATELRNVIKTLNKYKF